MSDAHSDPLADTAESDRVDASTVTPDPVEERTLAEDTSPSHGPRLGSYRLERRLGVGGMGEVYAARSLDDGELVALKTLSRASPTNLYRFKREFRALADVDHPNLIRLFELGIADDGRAFFTMELLCGEPFVAWLRRGLEPGEPGDERRITQALRELAEGVRALHARGCVHRDLKPSNVLIGGDGGDGGDGRVVILDFGLVSELDERERGITRDGQLLGTPAYMAPEQARGLPAGPAADCYAVGVMLYESLTGDKLHGDTMLPLVVSPAQVREREAALARAPARLQRLCLALLDYDPAQRPGAEAILAQLDDPRTPSQPPRADGASASIFVGRGEELRALNEAFRDSRQGDAPVVVQLRGRSGQGKSTLLREFRRRLDDERCLILQGRCRARESVPYKGVDAVVDGLSVYLRRLPAHEIAALRPRSAHALAQMFPVLDELWPELGPQALGPSEQRSVAWAALAEVLAGVAGRRSLIVLIDDVQWSDLDSVRLLDELLRSPHSPKLLLVLSLRPETGDDELRRTLEASSVLGAAARRVELGPLSQADALALTTALVQARAGIATRAESVALRSGGNPFYIEQLVRGEDETPPTQTDLDEVVARRLAELDGPSRRLLELVAVAGGPLSLDLALELCPEASPADVESLRRQALLVGGDGDAPLGPSSARLETAHDRIREVSLQQLTPARETELHRALGVGLQARGAELYEIVEHLNWTIDSETDPERLWQLAQLDLQAGQAGLRASAASVAVAQLEAGLRALARAEQLEGSRVSTGPGGSRHALALALAMQHARSVSLVGDHERAAALFDGVMASALAPLDYAKVALARVDACTIADRNEDAIRWGLAGLEPLGVSLSRAPRLPVVVWALLRMKWAFRAKQRATLDQLHVCEDPTAQLRMELLTKLVGPAFVVGGTLVPVIIELAGREGLRSGRMANFGFCLGLVSMLMAGGLSDYDGADELAAHALKLIDERDAMRRGITVLLAHSMVLHWTRPYEACFAGVEASFELALEEGDLEYATYAILHGVGYQSAMGRPLDLVVVAAQEAARFASETGMVEFAEAGRVCVRMFEALAGVESGAEFDPDAFTLLFPRCVAASWTMQPLVFLGDPERALAVSDLVADQVSEGLLGFYLYPEFVFYRGMAAALALDTPAHPRARRLRRILRTSLRKLQKWAKVYAGNLGPHARLLAAERARSRGQTELAQGLYEAASREAMERFPHVAALACERLGRLMAARGWDGLAQTPFARARTLYAAWGAAAKVAQLERDFPDR